MGSTTYWLITTLVALAGVLLFCVGYELRERENRYFTPVGLAGLALFAWGVLLAVLGLFHELVRMLT